MKTSVIICSHGAAGKLSASLARFCFDGLLANDGEIVLVCSGTDTATGEAMERFARDAPVPVTVERTDRRGLSVARNAGIARAAGDLLVFTDDDCHMLPDHIEAVNREMESGVFDYGGGGVRDVVFSPDMAHITRRMVINPHTLLHAGIVNGNNMFFLRSVFSRIGGFREDMGASSGTRFVGAEDLEMATRASLAGMTGILTPDAIVVHDHQREAGSAAYNETVYGYDLGRGSYYAYLIARGIHEAWPFWGGTARPDDRRGMDRAQLERLRREFHGAAEYLDHVLKHDLPF